MKSSLKEVNHTNSYLLSTAEQHKGRTKSPGCHTHRKVNSDSQSLCFYWYLRCQTHFKSHKTQNHSKLKHIIDTTVLDLRDLTSENQHFSSFEASKAFQFNICCCTICYTNTCTIGALGNMNTSLWGKKQAWKTFSSSWLQPLLTKALLFFIAVSGRNHLSTLNIKNGTWRITAINCSLVRLTWSKTVSPKVIINLKIWISTFFKRLADVC